LRVRDEDKVLEPYTGNACRTVAISHNVSVATTSIASAIVLAVISAITPDEHRDAQHAGEVRGGPGRVPSDCSGAALMPHLATMPRTSTAAAVPRAQEISHVVVAQDRAQPSEWLVRGVSR
jgi:hypothetical protein